MKDECLLIEEEKEHVKKTYYRLLEKQYYEKVGFLKSKVKYILDKYETNFTEEFKTELQTLPETSNEDLITKYLVLNDYVNSIKKNKVLLRGQRVQQVV